MSTTYVNVGTVSVLTEMKGLHGIIHLCGAENHILVRGKSGKLMLKILNEPCLHVSAILLCFFSRNQLRELPPCIGRLSNLVSLHVENNKLTQLCPEVVDCRKLEELVS